MKQAELEVLAKTDLKKIKEAHDFFKNAFIIMTDHDIFEDTTFRLEWASHLNFFKSISLDKQKKDNF